MELEDRVAKLEGDVNNIGNKINNEMTRREIFEASHQKQEDKIDKFMDETRRLLGDLSNQISVNSTKLWAFFLIGGGVITLASGIFGFIASKVFK